MLIKLIFFIIQLNLIKQQQMLSSIFTTNSTFQSLLQQFLNGAPHSINQTLLHKIMSTLRGQSEGIKSQFAFASVKKMIGSLQLNKNQQKTLKLLIIFDKLVQDTLYFEQISKIHFLSLQINRVNTENRNNYNLTKVIKIFWKIIKEKSTVIKDKMHVLSQKRSQRSSYFEKIKMGCIISQLETIERFFSYMFELVYYIQGPNYQQKQPQGSKRSKALQYLKEHSLCKLLALYNCQMICNKYVVKKLKQLESNSILKFKKAVAKFRQNCNTFITLIKQYSNNQIYQTVHFDIIKVQFNEQILQYIDNHLQTVQTQSMQPIFTNLPINLGKIIVEKKIHQGNSLISSRLKIKCGDNAKKQGGKDEVNVFSNWQNGYSHQFPQKQVLTVQLILQIKLEQSQSKNKERQEYANENQYASRCSYDSRSTNVTSNYQINYFSRKQYYLKDQRMISFENVYSKLQHKWNQS